MCQKSPGKSSYPELMDKIYYLYPQGYSSVPSMFNRGCLLAFKRQARGFSIKKFAFTIYGQTRHQGTMTRHLQQIWWSKLLWRMYGFTAKLSLARLNSCQICIDEMNYSCVEVYGCPSLKNVWYFIMIIANYVFYLKSFLKGIKGISR